MKIKDLHITDRNKQVTIIWENNIWITQTINLHTQSFENVLSEVTKECEVVRMNVTPHFINIYIKEAS